MIELARKAARDMSYKMYKGKNARECGHVVAMFVGIASNFNSSSSSSSCGMNSDGASKRKSEEDRALMEALNPIFEEIIETPKAFKPKQLAQCASAITKIVFSRNNLHWFKGHDNILENVGIDIGDSGEQQQSQNAMPGEDEEHLCRIHSTSPFER